MKRKVYKKYYFTADGHCLGYTKHNFLLRKRTKLCLAALIIIATIVAVCNLPNLELPEFATDEIPSIPLTVL
jgi:hypothetical protein